MENRKRGARRVATGREHQQAPPKTPLKSLPLNVKVDIENIAAADAMLLEIKLCRTILERLERQFAERQAQIAATR